MSEAIIKYIVQSVLALVLLLGMLWVVLTPAVNDDVTKAALVVISSAAGFLFAKHTN